VQSMIAAGPTAWGLNSREREREKENRSKNTCAWV
jgi:hypothetical protein